MTDAQMSVIPSALLLPRFSPAPRRRGRGPAPAWVWPCRRAGPSEGRHCGFRGTLGHHVLEAGAELRLGVGGMLPGPRPGVRTAVFSAGPHAGVPPCASVP